jgi:hypothetical protein
MKRRITGNNRKKISSLDAGIRIDRLVILQREKHGGTVNEALEVISRSHPQLYNTYLLGTGKFIDDEDFLAEFINTAGHEEAREIIEPVVNWETAPLERIQRAAAMLSEKLSEWKTSWYAHVIPDKKPFFMWSSQGDTALHLFYGMIATSLRTGAFWKLRQCRFCKSFFVSENQRENICNGKKCKKLRNDKSARESKGRSRRDDTQEEEVLASRLITRCRIERSILYDLQLEGKLAKTIKKIRDGFNKGWSSKKIVEGLSGKEKKRLADEYKNNELPRSKLRSI